MGKTARVRDATGKPREKGAVCVTHSVKKKRCSHNYKGFATGAVKGGLCVMHAQEFHVVATRGAPMEP